MEKICNLDKKYKYTIIATFFAGILAHGYMFTNKISYHDDIKGLFTIGETLRLGRWSLEIIYYILSHTVGKYSMPIWTGTLTMIFVSASACMIINLLGIKDVFRCILIGSAMIVLPTVTMTFLYMFTAGSYFGALFLSVFAVWILEKYDNIWSIIGAVICIAFSTGIYQAYFSVGISLILLLIINDIVRGAKPIVKACKFLSVEAAGLILYLIILKIWLYSTGTDLSTYKGVDSMLSFSVKSRLKRVLDCYLDIKTNLVRNEQGLVGNRAIRIILALCLVLSFIIFLYLGHMITDRLIKIFYYGVILALPIGINLIYPMSSDNTDMHPLMRYSMVFLWILPLYALELFGQCTEKRKLSILNKWIGVCVAIVIVNYIYVANITYTKISFLQEQTTTYFTVMITQIKSCEGYRDEMPVAFIGARNIEDLTFTVNNEYRVYLPIARRDLKGWVNEYSYLEYLRYHCGFSPQLASNEEVLAVYDEIENMPIYPDCGSIKVVDDIVVVKLSEVGIN